jgi:hypothetical protein
MDDATRFRLLGTYRTPRFRYGRRVTCEARGLVELCGLSTGRIPWPLGRPVGRRNGRAALVLCGALAEAVRRESALAVGFWWGVGSDTVWKWRKALGVGATAEGTSRLRHEYGIEPAQLENVARATARARDPERRAKISAARKGKPRPPHTGRAVAEAHRGTHHSAQTRARMTKPTGSAGPARRRLAAPGRPKRTRWCGRSRRSRLPRGRGAAGRPCTTGGTSCVCRTAGGVPERIWPGACPSAAGRVLALHHWLLARFALGRPRNVRLTSGKE